MKTSFYVKIFISFIIFASILLVFALGSFDSFYKENLKEKELISISKILQQQDFMLKEYLQNKKELLLLLKNSKAYSKYIFEKNPNALKDMFSLVLSNNTDLLQAKFILARGKEKLVLNKKNKDMFFSSSKDLLDISILNYYKNIRTLKNNEFWVSDITLEKKDGDIVFPLRSVFKIVLKTEEGFLYFLIDINKIFNKMKNSSYEFYIIDKNANFILHKNSKFNWSKYFFPNISLYNLKGRYYNSILNLNNFVKNDFISKRFYLDKNKYFIAYYELNKDVSEKTSRSFNDYFNSIIILGILIAIVLALLLSEPLVKLNKKIIEKNKNLNLSVQENSFLLNESLNTINKFVLSVRFDNKGLIIDLSNAFCDTSGFLKSELIGYSFEKLIYKDKNFNEYKRNWIFLKKGNSHNFEIKGQKKSGGYFWAEVFCEPMFNKKKELVAFNAIANEITDKKIIESLYNNINNQVSQYNAIFENVNSGIALVCENGYFKKVNSTLINLLGYSKDELSNCSCFDIITESSKPILQKFFDKAFEIGMISNLEKIFIHKDGSKIHLEMSLSLLNDKKHFVFVINSLEDKRKLQELNQNLYKKVNEELEKSRQKDKVHQDEQIRNAKLSSIGSLAAGITHEINTPLTYIKGNFEMMGYDIEDLPESALRTRMLEDKIKIDDGIKRIANIVESMREISQSSKETKENTNIYATLVTALTMAYNRSKQITKIYLNQELFNLNNIDKNAYSFISKVQKQRIEQVWIVIINNALDELVKINNYENRKLEIQIKENENDFIVLFKDNAGGINKDIIENIFDPFVSSKNQGGMGVGLNIAKKIINEQKGKIKAYNYNEGAILEVSLKKEEV